MLFKRTKLQNPQYIKATLLIRYEEIYLGNLVSFGNPKPYEAQDNVEKYASSNLWPWSSPAAPKATWKGTKCCEEMYQLKYVSYCKLSHTYLSCWMACTEIWMIAKRGRSFFASITLIRDNQAIQLHIFFDLVFILPLNRKHISPFPCQNQLQIAATVSAHMPKASASCAQHCHFRWWRCSRL